MKIFGCDQGSRAGHIFNQDGRMARNMFTHVAGHNAAVSIESTSGAAADDDPNRLTLLEIVGAKRGA